MAVVGEEDLGAVAVLGEEAAATQAVAVVSMGAVSALAVSAAVGFVVVVSAERRSSQAGPRASAERRTSQVGPRASEAEACHSQPGLAGHRSDRRYLRDPAG